MSSIAREPPYEVIEAARAEEAQSIKRAIELYGKMVEQWPSYAEAWLKLVSLLERKGMLAERDATVTRGRSLGISFGEKRDAPAKPEKRRPLNLKDPQDFLVAMRETPHDLAVRSKIESRAY